MKTIIAEVNLIKGVRALVYHCGVHLILKGSNARRVIVKFISDIPEKNKVIKNYYVWIAENYARKAKVKDLDDISAVKVALKTAQKRFEENGKQVPIEDGLSLTDSEQIIVDPKTFTHPLEKI